MEQESYKKTYSFKEFYRILYDFLRTKKYLDKAKKNNELSRQFIERIMLAVTEVNGCEVCSYAHTKWALETGMSNEEIQRLLAGDANGIPVNEMSAILFAQHYADTKGNPTEESWERMVEVYGTTACGILGAVREIMFGNVYGMTASAFLSRIKGKPYKKSNPFKELGMILCIFVYFPVAFIHAVLAGLIKKQIISF